MIETVFIKAGWEIWLGVAGILIVADIIVIAAWHSWKTRKFVPPYGTKTPRFDKLYQSSDRGEPVPIEYWEQFFKDK